jgi:hypothetical protein
MHQPMDLTGKVNASSDLASVDLRSDRAEELSAFSPVLATPAVVVTSAGAFAVGYVAGAAVGEATG